MPLRPILTGAVAGLLVPVAVLAVLVAVGSLAPFPALAGALVIIASAVVLAFLRVRDLARLVAFVSRASETAWAEEGEPSPASATPPRSRQTSQAAEAIERLSRRIAVREDMLAKLRRADEMVVERLPDPLIVLAADRSVLRTNAAARSAFGSDILAVLRHPDLRAAVERAFTQRSAQTAELSLPVPVTRDVRATVLFMDGTISPAAQALVVLSDRTRERAAERTRADFVANASHELRTPLASLIGFIDTLRGPAASDPPAQERFLGIMAEQAARMSRLIDDLLSLSRIELTEHQRPGDLVHLSELLPRIAATFEPQIAERGIALTLEVPELPPVSGDADQIEQVVQNLLDNAVKYGRPNGTVRIAASAGTADPRLPSRPGVLISVADDGQGIAKEHIPRLTERFYRADKGRSRAVGGTGLGLAIVKHIVNRHRGHLLIDSVELAGTIVSVWLPEAPKHGMSSSEQT